MTKAQLIEKVAQKCGQTKKLTTEFTDAFLDILIEGLINEGNVQLSGFGTFRLKTTDARMARNPKTNEPVAIPETQRVSFSMGKGLKDQISSK